MQKIFGLVGQNISYSFSVNYFKNKFENENITSMIYKNFDIPSIEYFPQVIKKNKFISGLNVTIPYKESIIPYLDFLSNKAEIIGAVNCIRVLNDGSLKGYNTDCYGFKKALIPLLQNHHNKALILGNGGASKAIKYTLHKLGINFITVSRKKADNSILYSELTKEIITENTIIINCTPLGTFPNIDSCPDIPYEYLSNKHICFDLVYNPSETLFMKKAKVNGAIVENGYKMLVYQAEKAWSIWNK